MSTTTSSPSSQLFFKDFLGKFHSRKLIQFNPFDKQQPVTAAPPPNSGEDNGLNSNVVTVLAFILCATICSIFLYFLTNCILKSCSSSESTTDNSSPRIAIANKGIKQKALKGFTVVKYSAEFKLPGLDTECVICLSEFGPGERVRLLPKCNHGFHVRCIDKWLSAHSSCPKCRNCLIETCHKAEATPSMPLPQTLVTLSVVVSLVPELQGTQIIGCFTGC
ncbi:hypothetical protein Dsin_006903 [Dipteronia sinensis]|uniref:RING-type E3 ubiquitin transferase n=1 Tax=Dipteronia sinensis TaxID=43782 RepID=A0AAE0AZH8_9ROSI|nr:hypothetical protein Dsin_006903 [Dipteronia sinensis]